MLESAKCSGKQNEWSRMGWWVVAAATVGFMWVAVLSKVVSSTVAIVNEEASWRRRHLNKT